MTNEQTQVDLLLQKINMLQVDFDTHTRNLYNKYENLIAEFMIAKGCTQGKYLEFNIPLIMQNGAADAADNYIEAKQQTFDFDDYEPNENDILGSNINVASVQPPYEYSAPIFNYDFINIWNYLNNNDIDSLDITQLGNVYVELNYRLTLSDIIKKTVTLTITKLDYRPSGIEEDTSSLFSFDDEISQKKCIETVLLNETKITETSDLLLKLYTPISIPDIFKNYIKYEDVKESIEPNLNEDGSPFTYDDIPF